MNSSKITTSEYRDILKKSYKSYVKKVLRFFKNNQRFLILPVEEENKAQRS